MWKLARAVGRLLHWWWRADRIRVSPREGRLLRLQPGDMLLIDGEPAVVSARQMLRDLGDARIRYCCNGPADAFKLTVRQTSDGVVIGIHRGGRVWRLADSDVEVFLGTARWTCSNRSRS